MARGLCWQTNPSLIASPFPHTNGHYLPVIPSSFTNLCAFFLICLLSVHPSVRQALPSLLQSFYFVPSLPFLRSSVLLSLPTSFTCLPPCPCAATSFRSSSLLCLLPAFYPSYLFLCYPFFFSRVCTTFVLFLTPCDLFIISLLWWGQATTESSSSGGVPSKSSLFIAEHMLLPCFAPFLLYPYLPFPFTKIPSLRVPFHTLRLSALFNPFPHYLYPHTFTVLFL